MTKKNKVVNHQKAVGCCPFETSHVLRWPLSRSEFDVERRDQFSDGPTPTTKANTNHQTHDDKKYIAVIPQYQACQRRAKQKKKIR